MQDIPPERELLVFYGGSYANGLGIDVKKYERYSGEEDQTEEAEVCEYCHIGMGSETLVKGHGCREKKDAELKRMAQTGKGSGFVMFVERDLRPNLISVSTVLSTL